jgi:hypothetical protein
MVLIEGRTGIVTAQDGSVNAVRLDKTGTMAVAQGHLPYTEAVSRGVCFTASTLISVAPGVTGFTLTPPITVWNPPTSNRNLAILSTSIAPLTATTGTGSIIYGFVPNQSVAPSGSLTQLGEVTPICGLLGAGTRGTGRAFTGSTVLATPTYLKAGFSACGVPTYGAVVQDELDGEFIVSPGTAFCMQGSGSVAGSTLIMTISWEEIAPI